MQINNRLGGRLWFLNPGGRNLELMTRTSYSLVQDQAVIEVNDRHFNPPLEWSLASGYEADHGNMTMHLWLFAKR